MQSIGSNTIMSNTLIQASIATARHLSKPSWMQSLLQKRKILIPLSRHRTTLLPLVLLPDISHLSDQILSFTKLGSRSSPRIAADDFFEVISKRYEAGSLIITANKPFEDWGNLFGDAILAVAILDRVVHHSLVFTINGQRDRSRSIQNKGGESQKNR